jgi:hypothetical protein
LHPVSKGITVLGGQDKSLRRDFWKDDIFAAVVVKRRVGWGDLIGEYVQMLMTGFVVCHHSNR